MVFQYLLFYKGLSIDFFYLTLLNNSKNYKNNYECWKWSDKPY